MTQKSESIEFANPRGQGAPWRAIQYKDGIKILNPNGQLRCVITPTEEGHEVTGPITRNISTEVLDRIIDAAIDIEAIAETQEV